MGFIKCPRCELNYMLDTETVCSVCRREMRGEGERFETIEFCSECGENPVVPGQELCASCLKVRAHRSDNANDEMLENEAANIGIDPVSAMEEIEIIKNTDKPFDGDDAAFDDDDDENDEDEEGDENEEDDYLDEDN